MQLVALQATDDISRDSLLGYSYGKEYWNNMKINAKIERLYLNKDETIISKQLFFPLSNSYALKSFGLFSQVTSSHSSKPAYKHYNINEIFEFCSIELSKGKDRPSKEQCELAVRRLTVPV